MKKSLPLIIIIIILPFALADNLYQLDLLQTQVNVQAGFDLIAEASSGRAQEVSADLLLFPQDSHRQKALKITAEGAIKEDKIQYRWDSPAAGNYLFGYEADVQTTSARTEVRTKVPFPIMDIKGYEQYTLPSPKIDSDNPAIIRQAAKLAEGEDDLFKVTFNLANWVATNVDYDLNALTTDVAQKASWVLQNRQGVCDEMTSLFVAMARSLGIPARFVSGISYTEHPDILAALGTNWASHGWAEVYFPDIGWVSFDIAFDEYGYIDVTHIKLREGLDPDEPATKFQWLASGVQLVPKKIVLAADVEQKGTVVPETIQLRQEFLAKEVDIGSANLVKATLTNTALYYAAVTVQLAVPQELMILGANKRTLLLQPKEVRETFWQLQVPSDLDRGYTYDFPIVLYTEKNTSVQDTFHVQSGKAAYSRKDLEEITIKDEEKKYPATLDCAFSRELELGQQSAFTCHLSNKGTQQLAAVEFCLGDICETVDLPPGEEVVQEVKVKTEQAGWNHLVVRAEHELLEKKALLQYLVLDKPSMTMDIEAPKEVDYGENIPVTILLKKTSFSSPQDVEVVLSGLGVEQRWNLQELSADQALTTTIPGDLLHFKNTLEMTASWEKGGQQQENIIVVGQAHSLLERGRMLINAILTLVS